MKAIHKNISGNIDNLLRTELSRKEFLQYMGVVLLGLVGITGLIKNLHRSLPKRVSQTSSRTATSSQGYGRRTYGS